MLRRYNLGFPQTYLLGSFVDYAQRPQEIRFYLRKKRIDPLWRPQPFSVLLQGFCNSPLPAEIRALARLQLPGLSSRRPLSGPCLLRRGRIGPTPLIWKRSCGLTTWSWPFKCFVCLRRCNTGTPPPSAGSFGGLRQNGSSEAIATFWSCCRNTLGSEPRPMYDRWSDRLCKSSEFRSSENTGDLTILNGN